MKIYSACLAIGALFVATSVAAQRVGDSVRVDYGTITGVKNVRLASNTGRGVALGGLAGLAASHGRDSSSTARRAAAGAAIGALISAAANRHHDGIEYSVELRSGSEVAYITEQRDIRMGDCVAVEQGDHVNLRRVSAAMCEHPPEVTQAYHAGDQSEAAECQMAKNELLAAEDEGAARIASVKVQALCHH